MRLYILPVLILLSAFEGVVPRLSFEREYEIVREKVIANYIQLRGSEIFLDPVWYFGPLQEYAIGESATMILDEILTPKAQEI